jgi:hypothetical protein
MYKLCGCRNARMLIVHDPEKELSLDAYASILKQSGLRMENSN